MKPLIDPSRVRREWQALADMAGFTPASRPRAIPVGATAFHVLTVPRAEEYTLDLYWNTGACFCARPRLAAYNERLVLIEPERVFGARDWTLSPTLVYDLCRWANHMSHVVTVSTLKSGASVPLNFHAQSFAIEQEGYRATALDGVPLNRLIGEGDMPHFDSLAVSALEGYPLRGLCLTGTGRQVADKAFELALNYDHLKAFNLVILPEQADEDRARLFFFPRRRDGRAIYTTASTRWQIAGLEANGILQAKTQSDAAAISAETIADLFLRTGLDAGAFESFLTLLDTF